MAQQYGGSSQTYMGVEYRPYQGGIGWAAGSHEQSGFNSAAKALGQGAQQGEDNLLKAYAAIYRYKAGGIAAAQRDMEEQAAQAAASQGLSGPLLQKSVLGSRVQSQQAIGNAQAETQGAQYQDVAQLRQGFGTQLANLMLQNLGMANQAKWNTKAANAAQSSALLDLGGQLGGAAITAAGGGAPKPGGG